MSELLRPTPGQTVGPFFHDALPFAGGPQLVGAAHPLTVRLHGTVFDGAGAPVPDALLEVRQADPAGNVPRVEGSLHRDLGFTGWGRAATDSAGRYSFTTLEPGPVAGGAPFFAVVVFARGLLDRLFTRCYLPGSAGLTQDPLLAGLDADDRTALIAGREEDGSLRFDLHLQGPSETPFLRYVGQGLHR